MRFFILKFTLLIFFSYAGNVVLGQYFEYDCEDIDSKKAQKIYNKAMELPDYKKKEFHQLLLECIEIEPNYFNALYVLADYNYGEAIYKSKSLDPRVASKSQSYFTRAANNYLNVIELCPSFDNYRSYFKLGKYYNDKGDLKKSVEYLQLFLDNNTRSKSLIKDAENMMAESKTYLDLINNPVPFYPKKIVGVSSNFDEYLPLISPDGKYIFFTKKFWGKRPGDVYEKEYEEFVYSERLNMNSDPIEQFSEGIRMPKPFNSGGNQGGVSISIDNNHLFVTMCEFVQFSGQAYNNCDIFTSDFVNGAWTDLIKLNNSINGKNTWEGQPSVKADGKTLFFASARPGGYGGIDLYKSVKDENGKWGEAINLGPTINTEYDDKSPFIHSDSKTLYFSSNGRIGVGKFDIYFAKENDDGSWGEPVNIGYPINTEDDDLGFIVSTDGKKAYFSSNKFNDKGGWDIYSFDLYEEAKPEKVLFVKGHLKDEEGNDLTDAEIEIRSTASNKRTEGIVDKMTGKYAVAIPVNDDESFLMTVKRRDFAFTSAFLTANDSVLSDPVEINMEVKPIEVGKTVKINNIHFATNSFDLTDTSRFILDGFVDFLNDNPSVKISIHGHTDNIGSSQSNMVLSDNRAKSVRDYIVDKGVAIERMKWKGFGATKPVASNSTEEGRALNRRTEFVILDK